MIRLALRVRREDAELALAELLELAPSGVEESEVDGLVEYAVYGPPGELPALPDLRAAAGGALVEIVTEEVPDDWHERWRAFHRPVLVSGPHGALRVRPPWEAPSDAGPRGSRDRSGPGLRYRRPRHDAAVPRAAARARAGRCVRGPRLRVRRAGESLPQGSAGIRCSASTTSARASRRRFVNARVNAADVSAERVRPAARRAGPECADDARQPAAPAAAARRPHGFRRRRRRGCSSRAACWRTRPTRSPRRSPSTRGSTSGRAAPAANGRRCCCPAIRASRRPRAGPRARRRARDRAARSSRS